MNRPEQIEQLITGNWKTREAIAAVIGVPEATISTYIKRLRKRVPVQMRPVEMQGNRRIWEYCIVIEASE